jgi:5-(carboxyamino)imidazole ribonucleotide synthase
MLFQAAVDIDIEVSFLVREADEGIRGLAANVVVGDLDFDTITRFASGVDVLTFEHELTPIETLHKLEDAGVCLRPSVKTMEVAANKLAQRELFGRLKLPIPHFAKLNRDTAFVDPCIAKAITGGYDGRGVRWINEAKDLEPLVNDNVEWLIEDLLDVEDELAVLTVSSIDGNVATYPPVRTIQRDGICVEVQWPPTTTADLDERAQAMASAIARELGAIGVLAVEFFVVGGKLYVNEIAPRVHNSGHLTIEAASTSQFENHLRAVAGLPLGPTNFITPAAMVNLIGNINPLEDYQVAPNTRLHLYGKTGRKGRKVGHVTATAANVATASQLAHRVRERIIAID